MKRNAKTLIAGMVALSISHAAMADDIKVAVVGAMSGPVAQWGDMEFNGARQAIKDINAKGGIKGDKLVGVEYDDACDPKQAVASPTKSLTTVSSTSSGTCVLPPRSLRLISTKTKTF